MSSTKYLPVGSKHSLFKNRHGKESSWDRANIFSKYSLYFMVPLFRKSRKKQLTQDDVGPPPRVDHSRHLGLRLQQHYNKELLNSGPQRQPSFLRALFKAFGWQLFFVSLLDFLSKCVAYPMQTIALGWLIRDASLYLKTATNQTTTILVLNANSSTMALNGTTNMINNNNNNSMPPTSTINPLDSLVTGGLPETTTLTSEQAYWRIVIDASLLVLFTMIAVSLSHPYFFQTWHIGMKCRVAACFLIYKKALRLSQSAMSETTVGQMVNLLSNDVNRFDQVAQSMPALVMAPLQAIIVVVLLSNFYLGLYPTMASLAAIVLYVLIQTTMGRGFSKFRAQTAKRTDERVRLMNEIILAMRIIKMYGWEKPFKQLVYIARKREITTIGIASILKSINQTLFFVSSKIIVFVALITYVLLGNSFNPEIVFVSIGLANLVRISLTLFFPNAISYSAETLISCQRINNFLLLPEIENSAALYKASQDGFGAKYVVKMSKVYASWAAKDQDFAFNSDSRLAIIRNLSLSIKPRDLVLIVGRVGSGKSSALMSILGELPLASGCLEVNGRISYASQEPWIFSGTVRENILFGKSYDTDRYYEVLRVCSLERDVEILVDGDLTIVGERGVSLSGGQKARVNLARALYNEADLYLLDDPLSAVDAPVAKHIFNESMRTFLRKKTVVLATHQLQFLRYASKVLVVDRDSPAAYGTLQEVMESEAFAVVNYSKETFEEATTTEATTDVDCMRQHQSRSFAQSESPSSRPSSRTSRSRRATPQEISARSKSVAAKESTLKQATDNNNSIIPVSNRTFDLNQESASCTSQEASPQRLFSSLTESASKKSNSESMIDANSQQSNNNDDQEGRLIRELSQASSNLNESVKVITPLSVQLGDGVGLEKEKEKAKSVSKSTRRKNSAQSTNSSMESQATTGSSTTKQSQASRSKSEQSSKKTTTSPSITTNTNTTTTTARKATKLVGNETRKGAESLSDVSTNCRTYAYYLRNATGPIMLIWFILTNVAAQTLYQYTDYFLSFWTDSVQRQEQQGANFKPMTYVDNLSTYEISALYGILVALCFFVAFARTATFFIGTLRSSINMHDKLFKSVVHAPMTFFDFSPIGILLNRFSRDVGFVDEQLPATAIEIVTIFVNITGIMVLTIIIDYKNAGSSIALLILAGILMRFSSRTIIRLKQIEGMTRSPIYSHISTTLSGLATIRAFKVQDNFIKLFNRQQDQHSGVWFNYIAAGRWLGFCMDWLCLIYIASVVTLLLIFSLDATTASFVGLLISQSVVVSGPFQWGVRQLIETESQMTSVQRLKEFSELEPEEQTLARLSTKTMLANNQELLCSSSRSSSSLNSNAGNKSSSRSSSVASFKPERGEVRFINLSLSYFSNEPPVLKDLNFIVRPCEKVGVVGRTGAGKSSIVSVLFRLYDFDGTIEIDGCDTKTLTLNQLRRSMSIIPQDPILFGGTIRKNLDPFNEYLDEDLWSALEAVKLKELIQRYPQGLEFLIQEGGSNFSVGQRQLICLARAIVRKNKILILDEATANVDPETDVFIQRTIGQQFAQCTVITIAHRLITIVDSDRVLVLDAGQVREYAEPYELIQDDTSLFAQMINSSAEQAPRLRKLITEEHRKRQDAKGLTT